MIEENIETIWEKKGELKDEMLDSNDRMQLSKVAPKRSLLYKHTDIISSTPSKCLYNKERCSF